MVVDVPDKKSEHQHAHAGRTLDARRACGWPRNRKGGSSDELANKNKTGRRRLDETRDSSATAKSHGHLPHRSCLVSDTGPALLASRRDVKRHVMCSCRLSCPLLAWQVRCNMVGTTRHSQHALLTLSASRFGEAKWGGLNNFAKGRDPVRPCVPQSCSH